MQTMGMFPNAGAGLAGAKLDAGSAMRDMRQQLFDRVMADRQSQFNRSQNMARRDRQFDVYSTLANSASKLPWGSWLGGGGPAPTTMIDNVPRQLMTPPQPFQDPYRMRTSNA